MTIKDLAKLANVSSKTISRVINNEECVSEETRQKVLRIIKENNYKPNIYAQSLRKKIQKNILVSVLRNKNTSIPQWIEILITQLVEYGNRLGYTVLMESYSDIEDVEKISMLNTSTSFLDGAIVFYERQNDPRISILKKNEIPYIIFDKPYDTESSYVTNTDYDAVLEGVEYFFSRGIKNIELLLGRKSPTNLEREKGAKEAYKSRGIDINKLKIKYEITSAKDAYEYMKKRLEKEEYPEAFFVSGDEKVLGVYKAIFEKKLKIPNDISIMGFDNIPNSEYYFPGLTTIKQDYREIAKSIFDYFIKNDADKLARKEIKTQIIIRESVK